MVWNKEVKRMKNNMFFMFIPISILKFGILKSPCCQLSCTCISSRSRRTVLNNPASNLSFYKTTLNCILERISPFKIDLPMNHWSLSSKTQELYLGSLIADFLIQRDVKLLSLASGLSQNLFQFHRQVWMNMLLLSVIASGHQDSSAYRKTKY